MRTKPISPLRYDPSGVFLEDGGLSPTDLITLAPQLETARRHVLDADVALVDSGAPTVEGKEPLNAAFVNLPRQLIAEYNETRPTSRLHRILQVANQLRDKCDRVVVLGANGSCMGAKVLMEALCDPYFNELSRGQRGSRPRMYFEGNNFDNDASQGLLSLLGNGRPAFSVEDRWGIVVISKRGGTLETAVAFRQYLAALRSACGDDAARVAELVIPVTGSSGKLLELAKGLGCEEVFPVPDGVGGRFSVLSAVGLMPAAILGIDVVKLLEGAVLMNEHFRTAAPGENMVLDYVAACHLLEKNWGVKVRSLAVWAKGLESVGRWYDQLIAETLGKVEADKIPFTAVNTHDLYSHARQNQSDRRGTLTTNLIVDHWRCDPLRVGHSEFNQDKLNDIATKSLPEITRAAITSTNQSFRENGCPSVNLHLPTLNAASLGQLLQMLMLATVVEARLLGINPYELPRMEKYKINMRRILKGE